MAKRQYDSSPNTDLDLEWLSRNDPDTLQALQFLIHWYSEYAKEVVIDRAIINLDGLKPVQRRILYAMHKKGWYNELHKSAKVVGDIISLHPHGDESIYLSMTRMVSSSLYFNFPMLDGKGDLGSVYSKSKPAHMRYTQATLNDNAKLAFEGMRGIDMVLTESGEDYEPSLLPIAVPLGLLNASSGIAVGMASNIPSFNFHEVLEATLEYIETGNITKLLVPDYTMGSDIVISENTLKRLRDEGKGSFKLRAKWVVDGNTIRFSEIPYYTTIDEILSQIAKAQIPGVSDYREITDLRRVGIEVVCSSKNAVSTVLPQLLKNTNLQMTVPANMMVIVRDRPKLVGIKDYIHEWLEFRKEVVRRELTAELEAVNFEIPRYELLVDLLGTDYKRERFMATLSKQGTKEARMVLREFYPDADNDIFDWILGMRLSSLGGVGNKGARLERLYAARKQLEYDLEHIPQYIAKQLREYNQKYSFPRKTTVSDVDYTFEREAPAKVELPAMPCIVQLDGKFFKRYNVDVITKNYEGIRCSSKDVISMIDTHGRLLRVKVEDIEPVSGNGRGVYLPSFLEIPDDFEIVACDVISDKKVGYVYSDGFVSVLDLSEWADSKRTTRMTQNGVSPEAYKIIAEFPIPSEYLYVVTSKGRFGFFTANEFKHKHRTARTKLINLKPGEDLTYALPVSGVDLLKLVSNAARYIDKLGALAADDTFNTEYLNTLSGA